MMINADSIQVTEQLAFGDHFIRPAYGSYCFASLPDTLKRLFKLEHAQALPEAVLPAHSEYRHVVLMLVDGFGWRFFEQALEKSALLKRLAEEGVVSRLTAMFPSTTSAHVTCINSGLTVAQSGVYEWFYYEPKVDQVIAPLLFSPAGEKGRELLTLQGVRPEELFPQPRLYPELAQGGVKAFSFLPAEYANSSYSTHFSRGAQVVPYLTWAEALTNLGLLLEETAERLYALVYFADLDTIAHPYGPDSLQLQRELELFWWTLECFFEQLQRSVARQSTLLLVTADHGIAPTNPATTLYLNQILPQLSDSLRRNQKGEPILFGGSPRDLFLYVQDEHLSAALSALRQALAGKAEVYPTQALLEAGIFGADPLTEPLISRLGNLVVLPYVGESVSWYVKDRFEQKYFGHHGGLTPEEMLIPLLAFPLS